MIAAWLLAFPLTWSFAGLSCSQLVCDEYAPGRVRLMAEPDVSGPLLVAEGMRRTKSHAETRRPREGEPWWSCHDLSCVEWHPVTCPQGPCEDDEAMAVVIVSDPLARASRAIGDALEACRPRVATTGPRDEMITASSWEEARENGRPENLLDGDPATIWHSRWSRDVPSPPHTVTVDLQRPCIINLVEVGRRPPGARNGDVLEYAVDVSVDGVTWRSAATGTWPEQYSGTTYAVFAPGGELTRYLRLRVLRGVGGWGSASHLGWR